MQISKKWRKSLELRLFAWLVDERNGTATGAEIAKVFASSAAQGTPWRGAGYLAAAMYSLARAGWVTWLKPGPRDNFNTTVATVTAEGYLFRDYMKWDQFARLRLNAHDTHRYVRSLETALAPFAATGVWLRDHPERREGADRILKTMGLSALQCELASEMVKPSGRRILWPWLPLNAWMNKWKALGYDTTSYHWKHRRDRGDGDDEAAAAATIRLEPRSDVVRRQLQGEGPGLEGGGTGKPAVPEPVRRTDGLDV